MICSDRMKGYFDRIHKQILGINKLCGDARKKGFDPEDFVEMPIVENMAERVEGLISVVAPKIKNSGVSDRIKKLEEKFMLLYVVEDPMKDIKAKVNPFEENNTPGF